MSTNRKKDTRRRRAPQLEQALVSTVSAWARGGQSPEVKDYHALYNNVQLYHNVGTSLGNVVNQFDNIPQGTAGYQRLGNKIFIKDLEMILVLNNKADRPNVVYRVMVVAAPATASADTFTELFYGGNFSGCLYRPNSICLHDALIASNQGSLMTAPTKERAYTHRAMIPINKMVNYDPLSGKCATTLNIYIAPYDAYATLTTDNIASVAQASMRIGFVDA